MKWTVIPLLILLATEFACARPLHVSPVHLARESPFVAVTVLGCYDGDTCTVTLPNLHPFFGERLPIRIAGVDTPEMHGRCPLETSLAQKARDFTQSMVARATRIDLVRPERDKYFRIRAILLADGVDVGQAIIQAGLGRPYNGGTRGAWC